MLRRLGMRKRITEGALLVLLLLLVPRTPAVREARTAEVASGLTLCNALKSSAYATGAVAIIASWTGVGMGVGVTFGAASLIFTGLSMYEGC